MRPAIATVVGPRWERRLVEHARTSGLARLVGRCCDFAGLADIAARADAVFIGSETHWLPESDLRRLASITRLIGVAADTPGARLFASVGVATVIPSTTPPEGMLVTAIAGTPSTRGRVVEVTGPRGAPGRSEVALALSRAARPAERVALVELDHAAPSLGLRARLAPSAAFASHRVDGMTLMPLPAGMEPLPVHRVVQAVSGLADRHDLTVLDGGPGSHWHEVVDVDEVVFVGEATDIGLLRLARLCASWMGPTPTLVVNRYRPGQSLRNVLRATGLEPVALIPDTGGAPVESLVRDRIRPVVRRAQRTAL